MVAVFAAFWAGIIVVALWPTAEERRKFSDARRNRRPF